MSLGVGDTDDVIEMSELEFEQAVSQALDLIPAPLAERMDNVVVLVEDDPPEGEDILGVYEGTPLTERDEWWSAGSLPDRIIIFRNPLLEMCSDREELIDEIVITVVHEVAHFFGIDDERLHELGWD